MMNMFYPQKLQKKTQKNLCESIYRKISGANDEANRVQFSQEINLGKRYMGVFVLFLFFNFEEA